MARAHWLKNMKIREVSLVDDPASPGADIIFRDFIKRKGGARDANGHFAGGDAPGHQASFSLDHDEKSALEAEIARREGEGNPMRHLDEVHSFLDYKRSQRKGKSKFVARIGKAGPADEPRDALGRWVAGALMAGGLAAGAHFLGRQQSIGAKVTGSALAGLATAAGLMATTHLTGIKPVKGGLQLQVRTQRAGKPAVATHINLKPSTFRRWLGGGDQTAAKLEGTAHPTNGMPIVTTRSRNQIGTPVPLNSPTTNWANAGGWPYRTQIGAYVPAGSGEQQKYIEEALSSRAVSQLSLPSSTADHSRGNPYVTAEGHIIPPGSHAAQSAMEGRYHQEAGRGLMTKALMAPRPRIFGKQGWTGSPFGTEQRLTLGAMRMKSDQRSETEHVGLYGQATPRAQRSLFAGPTNRRALVK